MLGRCFVKGDVILVFEEKCMNKIDWNFWLVMKVSLEKLRKRFFMFKN